MTETDKDTLLQAARVLNDAGAQELAHRLEAMTKDRERMAIPGVEANPQFDNWVDSLHPRHWARYDLGACRLGFEAAQRNTELTSKEE